MPHGKPDFSRIKGPVRATSGPPDDSSARCSKALEAELREAGVDVTF